MDFNTPAEAMREMSAVHPSRVSYTAPVEARGDRVVRWYILDDIYMEAYSFNRQIPGPRLRVTQVYLVRINVRNGLPESTTVHWHGLAVPNEMDGPAEITQEPVKPGSSYTYEFTVTQVGTFFYHMIIRIASRASGCMARSLSSHKTQEPNRWSMWM